MDNLVLLLFLISLILIPVSIFKPSILYKLFNKKPSRSRAGLTMAGFAVALLTIFGVITPNTSSQINENIDTKQVEHVESDLTEDKLTVTRIVDGDTIELSNGKKVRYIGIDTPESVAPNTEVECFGKEATVKNTDLVLNKEVTLVKDISETDQYGRLLRYVYVDDKFINDILVRDGYANASSYPPDIKYQDQFRQAEDEARTNNRGLWNECVKKEEPIVTSVPDNEFSTEEQSSTTPTTESTPVVQPTQAQQTTTTGQYSQPQSDKYSCDCKKTCPNISSCEEAQYLLTACGCTARDNDHDGIACDSSPLNCQN